MATKDDFKLNLQTLFEEYAWGHFNKNKSCFSRLFNRRSKFFIDVHWGRIEFEHETINFNERTDAVRESVPGVNYVQGKPKISEVILYESKYENRTPNEQAYNFSSTRDTKNSTTVQLQDSYTIGGSCNLEISIPGNIVNLGAGLTRSLTVTEAKTETFETTTSWTVNTNINVHRGHRAEAKVHVSERNYVADFEVRTTIKVVDGEKLPIAIRRVSDNKLVHMMLLPHLEPIFKKIEHHPNVEIVEYNDASTGCTFRRSKVIITSRGTCKSKSWKNQHVKVHSERISSYSCEEDESTNEQ